MENIIIIYLIKVSAAIAIFYGVYMLCMRNDTFLKLRRFFLLSAMTISLIYPIFSLELSTNDINHIPAFISELFGLKEKETSGVGEVFVPVGETYGTFEVASVADSTPNWEEVLLIVFVLVGFILLSRFIIQLLSVVKLRWQNTSEGIGKFQIVQIGERNLSSFSFFHWIFISGKEEKQERNEILAHEMIHACQLHSIDILFSEIFCILFWWNPISWLLRHELKMNLEYLADSGVLDKGYNAREYQYLLLQTANANTGISIINNFNVSQLKKRITMINKKKTSALFSAKYLLMLPIVAGLVLSNAAKASPDTNSAEPYVNEVPSENEVYDDKPFVTVEQMPSYPGGEKAMQAFIAENLKYPVTAQKAGIQGRVIVRFVVSREGNIRDVRIIRGIDPACDKEAIRVINLMPKWNPGRQNNQAVSVYYTIPIVYRLNNVGGAKVTEMPMEDISKETDKKVHVTVERMPSYTGGEAAMQAFIAENLKYPVIAQKAGIQGRVTVRFVVGVDGSITEVSVIRGISPECDAEAIRVVEAMPKWSPGRHNGKTVPVYYTLPIVYRLTKSGTEKIVTATYPGGKDAFNRFFAQSLRYPIDAINAKQTGLVLVKATILKTGEIGMVSVERGVSPILDKEVVRVVRSMEKWTPETRDGVAVDAQLSIPIVFRLKDLPSNLGNIPSAILDDAIVVVGYGA